MKIVAWLTEGTWQACVDATAQFAPPDAEIVLLQVSDPALLESLHGAYSGLLGRGRHASDPAMAVEPATRTAQEALFGAARLRLRRAAVTSIARHGRPEVEVIAAAAGASLLVVARDGDHARLGPRSLGHATRFVVDHAPCRVLLVWPDDPPAADTVPRPEA